MCNIVFILSLSVHTFVCKTLSQDCGKISKQIERDSKQTDNVILCFLAQLQRSLFFRNNLLLRISSSKSKFPTIFNFTEFIQQRISVFPINYALFPTVFPTYFKDGEFYQENVISEGEFAI